jgi:excisionase family DNA binding protein
VTRQTIRNWIDSGFLPAVRIGRAYRVSRADVEATLERAKAKDASHATLRDPWEPSTSRLPRRRDAVAAEDTVWKPSGEPLRRRS